MLSCPIVTLLGNVLIRVTFDVRVISGDLKMTSPATYSIISVKKHSRDHRLMGFDEVILARRELLKIWIMSRE